MDKKKTDLTLENTGAAARREEAAEKHRRETPQNDKRRRNKEACAGQRASEECGSWEAGEIPAGSPFLVARDEGVREQQKELLYEILGPVFFGEKQAGSMSELEELFGSRYGIDVKNDFYEGDDHYEEYLEAQQAIAEGMSIYGGRIGFADSALAELAERIWESMEKKNGGGFRRINTMLEE